MKVFEDQIVKVQVSRQLCSEWDWSSWVSTVKLLAVFSEFVALAGGCSVATAAHGCCHTKSHSTYQAEGERLVRNKVEI